MTVYSTIWSEDAEFNDAVRVVDWRELGWLRSTAKLRRVARHGDVVLLNGALGWPARWRDLVTGAILRGVGHRPGLLVADATWHPRSIAGESSAGWLWTGQKVVAQTLVRVVAGRRTTFCFLSRLEVDAFLRETGYPAERAVFTPFFVTIPSSVRPALPDVGRRSSEDPYVFSGGNTLRDWDLLCEALEDCGARVRVASRHTDRAWPSNFEVGPVSNEEFFRLAAGAAAGVVSLRSDVIRSAGQQSYLNLLALGVPVVVNDAPGVHDHLDGMAGAWVTGANDPAAMGGRVRWLLDPHNAPTVAALAADGQREACDRFGEHRYLEHLAKLARDLEVGTGA